MEAWDNENCCGNMSQLASISIIFSSFIIMSTALLYLNSKYYEPWLEVFLLMCYSLKFSLFQRLMAGDDAANKSILNEITILVSFYTYKKYL